MRVSDFDYRLPPGSIAQRPAPRGTSRLLTLGRADGRVGHLSFAELPELLLAGDVLVVNDTRVIPARLYGLDPKGRRTEFLLSRHAGTEPETWDCLAKPGRRAKAGVSFDFGDGLHGDVAAASGTGHYRVVFSSAVEPHLERIGSAPLPPYIHRPGGVADARDAADYQTVFAREPGAIAAPTAGLHFTSPILERIAERGATVVPVTLHVGIGTFKPVKTDAVEEHRMDPERGVIPRPTAAAIAAAKADGRRVVAVGTTSVRTLEASARAHGGAVTAGPFETSLFLVPGAEFLVVDALLTNFHLPRSTLLMLVSAFAGRERVLRAYGDAVEAGYRFFSYGDAMFVS